MVDQLIMGYQRQSAFRLVFEMQRRGYGVDPAPVVRLLLLTAGISTAQARSRWQPLLLPLNLPPRDPAHSSIVRKRPSPILNYLLPTMRNHQRVLRSLVQPLFYLRLLVGYECRMQMLEKNTCEETGVNPHRQMPSHKQMRRFPMYWQFMTKCITIFRKAASSVRGGFGHLHLQRNYDILMMPRILRRIESERGPILARSRCLQLDTNLLDRRQHQIHYDHLPQLVRTKLRMLMLVRQANMPSFPSLLYRIRKSQVLLLLLGGRDSKFCLNPYMLWTIHPITDVAYLSPQYVDLRDCSWSVLPSRIVSPRLYDYLLSRLCLANVFFTDCIYRISCTVEEGSRSVVRWRSTIKCQHPNIVWTWVKNVLKTSESLV